MSPSEANFINHITIVGDESSSMSSHRRTFCKVYDNLVKHLAETSTTNGQETRITTYLFSSRGTARCVVYDKDVLRTPSIEKVYSPSGMTAMLDATLLAIGDLSMIPEKYGSHAFLTFVLTDGQENNSFATPDQLTAAINRAADNHTYAAFVPDQRGVFYAKQFGFPKDNISVWDTATTSGVETMGEVLRDTTTMFMSGRSQGIHGYNTRSGAGLFTMRQVSKTEVKAAATPLTVGSYFLLDVHAKERIDDFVTRETRKPYIVGRAYYQFMKPETIQPNKNIAVEIDGHVYEGPGARTVLGLPTDHSVRVRPDQQPGATIFVQSTSYNRNLVPNTRLLVRR